MRARGRLFVAAALAGSIASIVVVAAIGILLYRQVSVELVAKTEEMLHERLHFVDRGVTGVFTESARMVGAFLGGDTPGSLTELRGDLPACRRIWVTFPDGRILREALTTPAYLERNPWWKSYESSNPEPSGGLSETGKTLQVFGPPFRDDLDLDTIIPIVVYRFVGVRRVATAFVEIDLTELLSLYAREFASALGHSFTEVDVSIYDRGGDLLESTANLMQVSVRPLDPSNRLGLSPSDWSNLATRGRLTVSAGGDVRLYRWDSASGLIIASRVPRSAIVANVWRTTAKLLALGLCSLTVIIGLASLFVRAAYRMRTFEEQQVRARLEMLQAKMNPHFLFNTLDSMVGVAADGDRTTLLKMLRSLSTMLHMSVRRHEEIITLEEELEYVSSYVELQRVRYAGGFEYQLAADRVSLGLYLPRFCIQPLVENSFVHGVAVQPSQRLRIVVTVRQDNHALIVTVSDDGPGCDIAVRGRLERIFADDARTSDGGIGLSAVHHRLRTLYGKRFGLRLLEAGKGFSIQVVIPMLRSA